MLQTKLEFYSFLCLMSHLLRKHKYMLILKADIYEARFCWSAQECSTAGQAFKMHLKECSFSSRPGLARFSMQSRGVWLCLMGWDLLRPKIAWLSPSYWPEYMRGAVCASQTQTAAFQINTWKNSTVCRILSHFAIVSKMTQGTQK